MSVDYSKYPDLIEACMEWLAMKWTKSMIRAELKNWFPETTSQTCQAVIKAAKEEIKRIYGIDAADYRGRQISFYELIIRNKKYYNESIKIVDRLKAAERLDKLFNLEGIQLEDADAIAERVRAALQEMDENQISEVPDDAVDKLKRLRKTYNDSQREGNSGQGTESQSDVSGKPSGRNCGPGETATVIPGNDGEPRGNATEGRKEPPTQETACPKETETFVNDKIPEASEQVPSNDNMDIEEAASFDDLPEEIKNLISNPNNDKAFEDFRNREKRRKELD